MASVSSSVSVGRPVRKYSFMRRQPWLYAECDRAVEVVLADQLVDDLAHAPGACLGRERQAGPPSLLQLTGDADRERVDPQARQRHATPGRGMVASSTVAATTDSMPEKSAVDSDVSATSS